jgi:hypothetical protein
LRTRTSERRARHRRAAVRAHGRAADAGWEFGGEIAGHLVGQFPHETIAGDDIESYIAPGSSNPMRRFDRTGRICHWILEVHLIDRQRQIGGFHEELLDLGDGTAGASRPSPSTSRTALINSRARKAGMP